MMMTTRTTTLLQIHSDDLKTMQIRQCGTQDSNTMQHHPVSPEHTAAQGPMMDGFRRFDGLVCCGPMVGIVVRHVELDWAVETSSEYDAPRSECARTIEEPAYLSVKVQNATNKNQRVWPEMQTESSKSVLFNSLKTIPFYVIWGTYTWVSVEPSPFLKCSSTKSLCSFPSHTDKWSRMSLHQVVRWFLLI